jgi:hypothetical protein
LAEKQENKTKNHHEGMINQSHWKKRKKNRSRHKKTKKTKFTFVLENYRVHCGDLKRK